MVDPRDLLHRLRAEPDFKELENIRMLAQQFILDIGITNAAHPGEETVEWYEAFMRDYDAVMEYLEFDIREARAPPPYPNNVPMFDSPRELIDHFIKRYDDRWKE